MTCRFYRGGQPQGPTIRTLDTSAKGRGPGPQTWADSSLASCPWHFWQGSERPRNAILLRRMLFPEDLRPHQGEASPFRQNVADVTACGVSLGKLPFPQTPPDNCSISFLLEPLPVTFPSRRQEHILDHSPHILLSKWDSVSRPHHEGFWLEVWPQVKLGRLWSRQVLWGTLKGRVSGGNFSKQSNPNLGLSGVRNSMADNDT